jgi:RNA polymerase sigma factor (sigma-70 family)
MTEDSQLLRSYVREKSQDAFTELVRRHLDLVYSAALRQVRSPQLAEEISQSVFTDLARAADKLKPDTLLTAWLYQVTRRTAIDVIRRESRRQARERLAAEMADMNTAATWTHIEPLLDDAMEALEETDRAAILLRYFENKSLRDVGQSLGVSDDAAQKRVSRAVERLREFFSKRGVAIGASGLVVLVSANAVQATPVALAATISKAIIIAGTTIKASSVITTTKVIAMTTLQKITVGATLAAAIGTGIYKAYQVSRLREQSQRFQREQAAMADQIRQLQGERNDAKNQSARSAAENGQRESNPDASELLRLRSEVTRLREEAKSQGQKGLSDQTNDPTEAAANRMVARVKLLKERLEQMPNEKIPELQFVTEEKWLGIANVSPKLDTDSDFQWTFRQLRDSVEDVFGEMANTALKKYIEANNGQFPTDVSQLQPYFKSPVDNAILQRYEVVPASSIPSARMGGNWLIAQKAPVGNNDSREVIGPTGYGHPGYVWPTTAASKKTDP